MRKIFKEVMLLDVMGRSFMVVVFLLVVVLPFASAGVWKDVKGFVGLNPTDVDVTVGNGPPVVTILSVDVDDVVGLSIGPASTSVDIVFTVQDPNGAPATELDLASLVITFTSTPFPADTVTTNGVGACSDDAGDPLITFTCTLNMEYFFAPDAWTADVSISDTNVPPLEGLDNHAFIVSPLLAIDISVPISFASVVAGTDDVTGPTTLVTNFGNVRVPEEATLDIIAEELGGATGGNLDEILAGSFTAVGTNQADVCGLGTTLVDATATPIPSVEVPRGNGVGGNNEETLSYCLDVPNIQNDVYSTGDGGGAWEIALTLL